MSPKFSALSLVALAVLAGCTKLRRGREDDTEVLPSKPSEQATFDAAKSTIGIMTIEATLRSDGLLLRISNVPADAKLDCDLDNKPLVPCHDGALFSRPEAGDHKVTAVALRDGAAVAFGSSAVFTVLPVSAGAEADSDPKSGLALVPDAAFSNGMIVLMNKDFKASFKFANTPECEAKVLCKYDSRTSQFWTECDSGSQSFTVAKDLLALGAQYLSVQASCGDRLGPILTLQWYGVPEDYQALMLKDVRDPNGRHVVELIREDDCVEGQARKFECAVKDATEFEQCVDSNTFDKPVAGSRVRFNCAGTAGPELVFTP